MAHTKTLLLGMAVGAGAALGLRELIGKRRTQSHPGHWHPDHIEMEPEDSRTETHFPNVGREWPVTRPTYQYERAPERARSAERLPTMLDESTGSNQRGKSPATGTTKDVETERQGAGGKTLGAPAGGTGRTQTETESELRRTGTDPNTVSYTRPTEPPTTSGGKAPFTKDE